MEEQLKRLFPNSLLWIQDISECSIATWAILAVSNLLYQYVLLLYNRYWGINATFFQTIKSWFSNWKPKAQTEGVSQRLERIKKFKKEKKGSLRLKLLCPALKVLRSFGIQNNSNYLNIHWLALYQEPI